MDRRRIASLMAIVLVLVLALPLTASAGRYAGGALVVHTDSNYLYYTPSEPCRGPAQPPGACEDAVTHSTRLPGSEIAVIWFLAAVYPSVEPGLTAAQFGVEHNLSSQDNIIGFGPCSPGQTTIELRDGGWPFGVGGRSGDVVAFGEAIRSPLALFYWFAVVADDFGSYFGSGPYPSSGETIFVDDSDPPGEDRITRFGTIRWDGEGRNACPAPPSLGACCTPWTSCVIRTRFECERTDGEFGPTGGTYLGDGTSCPPEPICGPCCFWTGEQFKCRVADRATCEESIAGDFVHAGYRCTESSDPESVAVAWFCDPNLAIPTSWGRLRAIFR